MIVGSVVQGLASASRCAISLHLSQDAGTSDSVIQGGVVRLTPDNSNLPGKTKKVGEIGEVVLSFLARL